LLQVAFNLEVTFKESKELFVSGENREEKIKRIPMVSTEGKGVVDRKSAIENQEAGINK